MEIVYLGKKILILWRGIVRIERLFDLEMILVGKVWEWFLILLFEGFCVIEECRFLCIGR